MKKVTRKITGIILIVLGLAALLTPLTPGSWLIVVGLELLGLRILLQDKLLAWARARPGRPLARGVCWLLRLTERSPEAKKKWRDKCPR
jgi:hypothetical protein